MRNSKMKIWVSFFIIKKDFYCIRIKCHEKSKNRFFISLCFIQNDKVFLYLLNERYKFTKKYSTKVADLCFSLRNTIRRFHLTRARILPKHFSIHPFPYVLERVFFHRLSQKKICKNLEYFRICSYQFHSFEIFWTEFLLEMADCFNSWFSLQRRFFEH